MKIIYFLLACLYWISANSQETLDLNDCISLALKNNAKIKNNLVETEQSKDAQKEAFTNLFPKVSAFGSSYISNKGILETELIPGMNLSLLKKGIVGGITAIQPIYAGGQIYNSNRLASAYVDVRDLMLEQTRDDIRLVTERYYWQYILLTKKMETLDMIEHMIASTCKDVEVLVKSGITTTNNLLEVELRKNEIASNKLQLKNATKHLKMFLAQHIGFPVDSFIVKGIEYDELVSPIHFKVVHKNSLLNTVPYQLNHKNLEIAKLQTKIERGKYMPSVAVGAGYMYHNLLEKDHPFGIVYATVSLPISQWWGGKHAINQKRREEVIAQINMDNTNELLLIQMQQNYDDLEVAYDQVKISQRSIDSAYENVRLNTEYFKAGTINLTSLLDSQVLLQQAHNLYVEKYTEYLIKKSIYKTITSSSN